MELPAELTAVLAAAVGMLVAEGLQSLGRLLNRDFSGHAAALTAAIVGLLVAIANGLLGSVPVEYAPFVNGLLAFLVIVLGPMAIHSIISKLQSPSHASVEIDAVASEVSVENG